MPPVSPSLIRVFALSLGICCFAGCKRVKRTTEHIDAEEREIAAKLQPAVDPVQKEIAEFSRKTRESFGSRRFDELEKVAKDLRATKALFGNGSWKLSAFYESFTSEDKNEEFW